jgi:hypothetical protein
MASRLLEEAIDELLGYTLESECLAKGFDRLIGPRIRKKQIAFGFFPLPRNYWHITLPVC